VAIAKVRCAEAKKTLDRLSGVKPLNVSARICAPGLPLQAASGIYEMACFDAHHDLSALERRHDRIEGLR
jgi:hypothetical protein